MKVLMLTPYLPFPPSSGGQIRTLNLLKYLSKNNEITLVSLYKFEKEKEYLSPLQKYCRQIYLCKRAEKPWQMGNIFRAIFSLQPFLVVRNFSQEAVTVLKDLLKNNQFDVIHAETFYIMPHLPKTKVPVILVEQTIEYKVYQHFVHALPFFMRPFFYLDILKLIYWEKHYWRKANLVAAVSESDSIRISQVESQVKPIIVPNGAGDEMLEAPLVAKKLHNPKLLFIGNFFWLQNVEAATFLVNKILPLLKKLKINFQLIIAGQNASNKLPFKEAKHLQIIDIGPKDDYKVKKLYREATLFLAPIFGPGGTRLKILAAMASALPIIATKTGVDGLSLNDGENVLIASTPQGFTDQVSRVLSDQKLYNKIQRTSYELVREKYSWKKIAMRLEDYYLQIKNENRT